MYDILSKCLIYNIYKLENSYICNKSVGFFNAAAAKKDEYPENILVRKDVSLSKYKLSAFAERSALAIGNKSYLLINFASIAIKQ